MTEEAEKRKHKSKSIRLLNRLFLEGNLSGIVVLAVSKHSHSVAQISHINCPVSAKLLHFEMELVKNLIINSGLIANMNRDDDATCTHEGACLHETENNGGHH